MSRQKTLSLRLPVPKGSAVPLLPAGGVPHVVTTPRSSVTAAAVQARELWLGVHVSQLAEAAPEAQPASQLLVQLATIAQRFTSRVSLVSPDGLLLEIRGSLRLFGGAASLYRSFRAACVAAGAQPGLALAPTALAALIGARSGRPFRVLDEARLVGALTALPLTLLRWPPEVLERLGRVGVRTVGEALRLPRSGFARRFGVQALASLDQLVGRAAHLLPSFEAPERFHARRSFMHELESHDAILRALLPLLRQLARFLTVRQCGIMQLECRLHHAHAPASVCSLELVAPASDPQRLQALLAERLALLVLPEPARGCELCAPELLPLTPDAASLWQPGEHGGVSGARSPDLIERLRARLGAEAVYGLEIEASHRPEAASRRAAPANAVQPFPKLHSRTGLALSPGATPRAASAQRPLWLLITPEPLAESGGLPRRRGPLRLLGEPERIETGWWEEAAEVARDYYRAIDIRGVQLWVFREREPPHLWFLHGVFG